MRKEIKRVCVYCSASDGVAEVYYKDAKELGEILGKNGYDIVYGGSNFGLMGAVSQAAKSCGSMVFSIMPNTCYNQSRLYAHKDNRERNSQV